ncbi:MAG: hypothetical protein AB1Z31_02050 [Desulfobacterales bacterium]
MGNSDKNSNQADRSSTAAEWLNPGARWTLLFIGNRGKPITIKRFKGMVLITLCGLGLVIALAVGLYWWNRSILQEKNLLDSKLQELTEQNQELRHERDILLTRLVIAESRALEKQDSVLERQSDEEPPGQTGQVIYDSVSSPPPAMTTTNNGDQIKVKAQPDAESTAAGLSVAIEDFKLSVKSSNNSLRVRFKLKNTSSDSRHVSGHAIVVLKGEKIQENQWVSLPGISLIGGKPTGKQQGNAFGIKNFKMMQFTANKSRSPELFQTASVYVFAKTGELLLEQDFPVKLSR